jgi:UDP-2,3-diacylglucosamine hydrolase
MPKQLKEGALFIADAHYPHHGDAFLTILKKIEAKELTPPQLFLMGDIFDLLFGHNNYIETFSKPAITLLQKLSKELDIIYLEGNHDFCLKELFPNITVYSRREQPVHYKLAEQNIYLAHGDKYTAGALFNLYSTLLRTKTTLTLLKPLEKRIIDHRMGKLKVKSICGDFKGYQKRFDAIRSHYPKDALIIEGHFHQALQHKNYISLPSLACQAQVGVVKGKFIKFYDFNLPLL